MSNERIVQLKAAIANLESIIADSNWQGDAFSGILAPANPEEDKNNMRQQVARMVKELEVLEGAN